MANRTRRKRGLVLWTILVVAIVALAGFGVWRWAVAAGSAATLEWIDARFPRDGAVHLAARGKYGLDPAQKAELWVPDDGPRNAPLVVFIHGGGWHSGAPEDYRFVARTLGEHGLATALVGYRLNERGRFPTMLEDSAAGVRWALDNARSARIGDGGAILMGHSAGAYNVLMLTLDPQWLAAAGVPQSAIAGTVSLAGPADFYPFTSDSARDAMRGAADPRATQPIAFARGPNAFSAPPILLLHGTADDVVRPRNSRNLAAAIEARGGPVEEIEFARMGHAGIIMGLSKPFAQGGKVLDPILRFIRDPAAMAAGADEDASVPVQRQTG